MFEIMIAAAAAAQPAPRIVAVPSPPPFVALRIPHDARPRDDYRRQPDPLQIRVSGGGRELWRGTLNVSQAAGANYSEQLSEAPPASCSPESGSSRETHQLRVSVHKYGSNEANDRYTFDVHWDRPGEASACSGVRGVRLQQQFPLAPGQSITLQGDAGLTVQIRRL